MKNNSVISYVYVLLSCPYVLCSVSSANNAMYALVSPHWTMPLNAMYAFYNVHVSVHWTKWSLNWMHITNSVQLNAHNKLGSTRSVSVPWHNKLGSGSGPWHKMIHHNKNNNRFRLRLHTKTYTTSTKSSTNIHLHRQTYTYIQNHGWSSSQYSSNGAGSSANVFQLYSITSSSDFTTSLIL
jgi:hypothetical protein